MKTTRRVLGGKGWLGAIAVALLVFDISAHANDAILPVIGGGGGGFFVARCPPDQMLTGLELRTADDVDAIRPLCVSLNSAGAAASAPALTQGTGLEPVGPGLAATLFKLPNGWYGGTGGSLRSLICPANEPIVTSMFVGADGEKTVIVGHIYLFCAAATAVQTATQYPAAKFEGRQPLGLYSVTETQHCPSGLVGVGINGRSGVWLDAVGLICGSPPLLPATLGSPPVKAVGRVKSDAPAGPALSICEAAREARSRNSPAAPGLEAQCRAAGPAGENVPVKAVGRVAGDAPAGPPPSICDAAQEARARNSPAAPGLEAQCRAAGEADALAAKGEAIANADPLSVELRNREPEGPARRGFDIGMAAAEGQTEPGPSKQRIHDALSPEEQAGFEIAVLFSLERNRNAGLAANGAAIAAADPIVAEARIVDPDVFYWLGFDIATGIFGDPALGAQGHTAVGPGSQKIRDALDPAGRRGFDASVALHLSRNYKP